MKLNNLILVVAACSLALLGCNKEKNPLKPSQIVYDGVEYNLARGSILQGIQHGSEQWYMFLKIHNGTYNTVQQQINNATVILSYRFSSTDTNFIPEGLYTHDFDIDSAKFDKANIRFIDGADTTTFLLVEGSFDITEREDNKYTVDIEFESAEKFNQQNNFDGTAHFRGHARVYN